MPWKTFHKVALALLLAAIGTSTSALLTAGIGAGAAQTSSTQEHFEPVRFNEGTAHSMLVADEQEYRKLSKRVANAEPYIQARVMDELGERFSHTTKYPQVDGAKRTPEEVLEQLLSLVGRSAPGNTGDLPLKEVYAWYKSGIEAQSAATRQTANTHELAARYRPLIVEGMNEFKTGPRGVRALRELFTFWPPLGASLGELEQVAGITDKADGEGVVVVRFDDGRGMSATIVRLTFAGDRLVSVGYGAGG